MFQKLINSCVKLVQRYLPEPFIFAIILTVVAFAIALPVCDQTLVEVVEKIHWAVCALCGGDMDGGAGNDNEKKDPATSEVSSAVP